MTTTALIGINVGSHRSAAGAEVLEVGLPAVRRLSGRCEDLQGPSRRYDFKPFFEGTVAESPRREFFYFSDNADLMAVRYNEWKITFKTIVGNLFSGKEDSTNVPLLTNLRVDPWERYQAESTYGEWWGKKLWVMMPAMTIMGQSLHV